ncbi:response regulator transcription factor [Sulfurimonas sp.]
MEVVLYSDDINLLSHWEKALQRDCKLFDTLEELYLLENKIIILNFSACIPNCDAVLKKLNAKANRVLILHKVPEFQVAKKLLKLGAYGYGNARMRDHFIVSAVNAIREGMIWLYPEFTSQLIMEIPANDTTGKEELLQSLTSREKEVAQLLKESLTYKEVAEQLEISPRTIKAHASQIYSKLGVKDRLGLALLLK